MPRKYLIVFKNGDRKLVYRHVYCLTIHKLTTVELLEGLPVCILIYGGASLDANNYWN